MLCDAPVGQPEEERCNRLDDDCDGATDEVVLQGPDDADWVCVPPTGPQGTWIGSPEDEVGRGAWEDRHRVVLTRPQWTKATEVTQAEWEGRQCAVAEWLFDPPPSCPGYRLPTEAEWEWAARAGTETAFYNGASTQGAVECAPDPVLRRSGWYCDNSGGRAHAVADTGSLPAVCNAWGLCDMHGNVGEWVWDSNSADTDEADDAGPLTGTCYSGPPGTRGVGACEAGTRTCLQGQWAACEGAVLPAEERCDGGDEDCDGETDEGVPSGCPAHPLGWPARCNAAHYCEYAPDHDDLAAEVYVPPGSFPMGAPGPPDAEAGSTDLERPVHPVDLATGFFIGKYEVTVARYRACVDAVVCGEGDDGGVGCTPVGGVNPSTSNLADGHDDHPANCLSWRRAKTFCTWDGGRLPTEAEWEYAATGEEHRIHPWGDEPAAGCDHAVVQGCPHGVGAGDVVGSRPPGASATRALDMVGNLHEWVEDCAHSGYTGAPEDGRAWDWDCEGNGNGVLRGASWITAGADGRTAWRQLVSREPTYAHVGVRCVRPLAPDVIQLSAVTARTSRGRGPRCLGSSA